MHMIAEFIKNYRDNRRLLLLIVYIALFLDNMLLTTVGKSQKNFYPNIQFLVPIIPEYLLRISHPNASKILLDDKIPDTQTNTRGKRQVGGWDNMDWDNTWDTPGLPNGEGLPPKVTFCH